MKEKFIVSAAPHLHDKTTIPMVMWNVVLALSPALAFATYFWGFRAFMLTMVGAFSAVVTEAAIQKFRKVPISVIDGSAFLTGMLLSFNIHAASPIWLPIAGSVFAIAVGKQVFGGLGNNPVNPALLGRAFLLASWPTLMTGGWIPARIGSISGINPDLVASNLQQIAPKAHNLITSATPLGVAKALRDTTFVGSLGSTVAEGNAFGAEIFRSLTNMETLKSLFWGNVGGCIGEVSAFALLLGAAYLLYKNIIEWRIPLFYIGSVFILSFFFGGIQGEKSLLLPFFHIFSGGLMLGAFFMATDYTTSPLTKKGRIIFALGCGVLTIVIRLVGGYPEGVSYSILFMNVMTPLIDRLTMPKTFGEAKK